MAQFLINNSNIAVTTKGGIISQITDGSKHIYYAPQHASWCFVGNAPTISQLLDNSVVSDLTEGVTSEYVRAQHKAVQSPQSGIWCELTSSFLCFHSLFGIPMMFEVVRHRDRYMVLRLPAHDVVGTIMNRDWITFSDDALSQISYAIAYEERHNVLSKIYREETRFLNMVEEYPPTNPDITPESIQDSWWESVCALVAHEVVKVAIKSEDIAMWRINAMRRAEQRPGTWVDAGTPSIRVSRFMYLQGFMFEVYTNDKPNGTPYSYTIFLEYGPGEYVGRIESVEHWDDAHWICKGFAGKWGAE